MGEGEKLILVGGRWHVARLIDYGHIGMGWGDPEDTSLICVAGDEERVAELPLPSGAEPVAPEGWVLVPREPTPEMCSGAAAKALYVTSDAHRAVLADGYARIYRDLIAAAPASPQSSSQVTEERVEAAARAIFDTWSAQTTSYSPLMTWGDALRAATNPADFPKMAKIVPLCRAEARAAITAALSPVKGDGQ